jgi:hypothetical protein
MLTVRIALIIEPVEYSRDSICVETNMNCITTKVINIAGIKIE